jgi:hypothetical protein
MNTGRSISGRPAYLGWMCLTYFAGALRINHLGIIDWAQRSDASLLPCCKCRWHTGGKVPFAHSSRLQAVAA